MKKKKLAVLGLAASLVLGGAELAGCAVNNQPTTNLPEPENIESVLQNTMSETKATISEIEKNLDKVDNAISDEKLKEQFREIKTSLENLLIEAYYFTSDFDAELLLQKTTKLQIKLNDIFTTLTSNGQFTTSDDVSKLLETISFEFKLLPGAITRAAYYQGLNNWLSKTDCVKVEQVENFKFGDVVSGQNYNKMWIDLAKDRICGEYARTDSVHGTSIEYTYGVNRGYFANARIENGNVSQVDEIDNLSILNGKFKHNVPAWLNFDIDSEFGSVDDVNYSYNNGTYSINNNRTGSEVNFTIDNKCLSQIVKDAGEDHSHTYILTNTDKKEFEIEYSRLSDLVNNAISEYNATQSL